ncbi:CinA family protein [Reinekea marinisedimentorum]|uniref:Nicotinamide-nucleotide amidase n=1 Tax=Reinekea marinisedimentorum TaxID=230495 RepID=A0A4V2UJM4_9GAMM|nr:CinA family protein [Reinekea marinisedimentorum]TCS40739.1 nicotinamide-nucleotide amidase [Reinekea marinisedimentorum]
MQIDELARLLVARNETLATVESCTGGGIAKLCTDLAGSSEWFLGAVVTYSNEMKIKLGVQSATIEQYGAVSCEVTEQMAECGRNYAASAWALSVSGIAGPGGGTESKPVGTVCFSWANGKKVWSEKRLFSGDRQQVRDQAADYALVRLVELLSKQN